VTAPAGLGRRVPLARAGDVMRHDSLTSFGNRRFQSSAVLPPIKARYRTTKTRRRHPRPPQ